MDRREFLLKAATAAGTTLCGGVGASASVAWAAATGGTYRNTLVLIELKGGNDGLNTVVPYADRSYYTLRPRLALPRDKVLPLSETAALHPALAPLLPVWNAGEMAVLQGVGYPQPNLSHFRSIEIWDTASDSATTLTQGWLARTFTASPPPRELATDGVVIGSNDPGPFTGSGPRVVTLAATEQFLRQSRLATASGSGAGKAMAHILKVEADVRQAARQLATPRSFATPFPATPFGNAVRTACEVMANPAGVAVLRLTLAGFDTHIGQAATQARLLAELAEGVVAMKSALAEIGRWDDTLILTYAEFGRRPKENGSLGTDHGTASAHFAWGGRVRGGFFGAAPALARLDGTGNVAHALDFRAVYATVLEQWWRMPAAGILGGSFDSIALLRA